MLGYSDPCLCQFAGPEGRIGHLRERLICEIDEGYSQYGLPLLLEPLSLLFNLWSTDQLQSWVYRLCHIGTLHIHPLHHCMLRPLLSQL